MYCVYMYVAMELCSFTAGLLAGMWEFPLFPAHGEDDQEKYLKRRLSEIGIALKDSTPMDYVGEVSVYVCACMHVGIMNVYIYDPNILAINTLNTVLKMLRV